MIKFIERIEKSKTFWFLLIIFIVFFLLRLPSVLEPNWYGDEGVYQVIGRAIDNGRALYSEAWDNKPPLLYLTYALFSGDHFNARFFSLIIGLLTTGAFFALSQAIFKKLKTSIVTTSVFTLLFATPLIEGNIANAENLMLLPITLAALIIYKFSTADNQKLKTKSLFIAGLLLGIAFLFKIVAIFDFAAFAVYLLILALPDTFHKIKESIKKFLQSFWSKEFLYSLGFLLPILITVLYFVATKTFPDFYQATFGGMFGYVGYGNTFVIPQGLLILKLVILSAVIVFLLIKRKQLSQPTIFVLLWIVFSLFNALFSQRPYTHYMLVLVPSFCLLIGLAVHTKVRKAQLSFLLVLFIVLAIILTNFKTYHPKKLLAYYQNAVLFMTNQKDVISYQAFFDRKTPRDYAVAAYIKMNSKPNDPLFIWGDSPQIYTLSNTLPINKYTVAYHIKQSRKGLMETQQTLDKIQPKYVIILSESSGFPFKLDAYVTKFSIENAVIYERAL